MDFTVVYSYGHFTEERALTYGEARAILSRLNSYEYLQLSSHDLLDRFYMMHCKCASLFHLKIDNLLILFSGKNRVDFNLLYPLLSLFANLAGSSISDFIFRGVSLPYQPPFERSEGR